MRPISEMLKKKLSLNPFMMLVARHELEEIFFINDKDYPGYNEFLINRNDLPDDFEVRTPTLKGISPMQNQVTRQAIEEYLEPEIEVIYELEADYEPVIGKVLKFPTIDLGIYKNKYERYLALCAAFCSILFLIGGLSQVSISMQTNVEEKSSIKLVLPEIVPLEEPSPAGEERVENMSYNSYSQRELTLPHSQPIASDWSGSSRRISLRCMDTEFEITGVTSEIKEVIPRYNVHKLFDLTDEGKFDEQIEIDDDLKIKVA